MRNVSLIGIGKLGICFALTLEKNGFNVIGVDVNEEYVRSINDKSYKSHEQNVEYYLKNSKNFRASNSLEEAINFSDVIFVLVATPSMEDGRYDHSQVDNVVNEIISFGKQNKRKDLVICCTTMPGYCDTVQEKLENYNYVVSYNPEFIAQGTILKNQEEPDMVLIGAGDENSGNILKDIYNKHTKNNPDMHVMSRTEAELCKISLNCFLTTKISFANMIGDIALESGCRPEVILSAIGSDTRIGPKYLSYGFGFGGPCFPRDNRALGIYAQDKGIDALISKASDESNELHLSQQIKNFVKNNPDKSKEIVFDSVTYKPESTMLIESQQLIFAVKLAKLGYSVLLKEREEVIKEIKERYGNLFIYQTRGQ